MIKRSLPKFATNCREIYQIYAHFADLFLIFFADSALNPWVIYSKIHDNTFYCRNPHKIHAYSVTEINMLWISFLSGENPYHLDEICKKTPMRMLLYFAAYLYKCKSAGKILNKSIPCEPPGGVVLTASPPHSGKPLQRFT